MEQNLPKDNSGRIHAFALRDEEDEKNEVIALRHLVEPRLARTARRQGHVLVTAPIVGIVEHDAYILTMLYVIRDLSKEHAINPWPLYWSLLWAGTLGSNLTIAGAPALFVAKNMGEKEDQRKVSLKEFFSYTVPYVIISLIFCYIPAILIWVLPFQK
jgi:Na+/H+ antiporter NhaD/arsenite permease-like protein